MKIEDAKTRFVEKENKKSTETSKSRISIYAEDYKGEYYNLPVDKLKPFKNQARKHFDKESIAELANTIREHGIRQPLTVLPLEDEEGYYEIISGERRYRAALQLGLKLVPCIIFNDRTKAEEVALIENIQRKDLHPIELMHAYNGLLEKGICDSMRNVAEKLGISKSSVVEIMNLKQLPEATQELLLITQQKSRALLRKLCKARPEEHEGMIKKHMTRELSDNITTTKQKSINPKTNVLNIIYDNNMFFVEKNRVADLSVNQKEEVKKILSEILSNI